MKTLKMITGLLLLSPVIFAGCQQNKDTAPRFEQIPPKRHTAVESAIELSDKYVRTTEELAMQKRKYQDLAIENEKLKEQLKIAQAQLKQSQKELNEANELLIEMRVELNNWKKDVLGFRDEIRQAQTAQLQALYKILRTLGGETDELQDPLLDQTETDANAVPTDN